MLESEDPVARMAENDAEAAPSRRALATDEARGATNELAELAIAFVAAEP